MNDTTNNCPKCGEKMLQGFIPDFTYGGIILSAWHEGVPETSFWKGIKASRRGGLPIGALRCSGCGYLELYADKRFQAQ